MNVKKIRREINLHSDFKIILFGSFISQESFNDIDILLLYNSHFITSNEILLFRETLISSFNKKYSIILDISLLSYIENTSLNLLSKINKYIEIEQEV
ncbi:nucleotidyltransferase domain-containing protein [Peribacillus frigoritolerans]|uniref:nucleotidyltransferase domain-containing protein n=1 Tax=Peribacillus frigoritolerans TaxID=450367 RepID=UPI003D355F14